MGNNYLPIFLFIFMLAISHGNADYFPGWCIASTGASPQELQSFLDYGCSQFDCSAILPGGACYEPNDIFSHTSWILDKFYREAKFCKEGLGYVTRTNPSRDACVYP